MGRDAAAYTGAAGVLSIRRFACTAVCITAVHIWVNFETCLSVTVLQALSNLNVLRCFADRLQQNSFGTISSKHSWYLLIEGPLAYFRSAVSSFVVRVPYWPIYTVLSGFPVACAWRILSLSLYILHAVCFLKSAIAARLYYDWMILHATIPAAVCFFYYCVFFSCLTEFWSFLMKIYHER